MKATAVEWFFLELYILKEVEFDQIMQLYEKAKEMEKEQIMDALCKGHSDCGVFTMESECEQYYKETYESKTNL